MNNKIIGSLYGAALGDALGAPTELRSIKQIIEHFNGYVYDFKPIPEDVFARGKNTGTITDDFSLSYYLIKEIIKNDYVFNDTVAKGHVVAWSNDAIYYENFAGPTTRMAIENIKNNRPTDIDPFGLINHNAKATNGVAMKVAPVALMASSLEEAISNAIKLALPTHYNSTAISGACAIAASVYEAKNGGSLDEIIRVGKQGADIGRDYGISQNHVSVAPSISYRIDEAVKIGQTSKNFDELLINIETKVGTNIQVTESVAAVYAILAFTKGDPMMSIYAGVNCGGDTDTIATMVGAITGGMHGAEAFNLDTLKILFEANKTLKIEEAIQSFADHFSK